MCCVRKKPNVLSQAHTHSQMLFRPDWPCTGPPPCTIQWYCQESTTQPTTCCSVKPCVSPSAAARRSTSQTLYSRTRAALTNQGGGESSSHCWCFGFCLVWRSAMVVEQGALETGVGSCCQGRWCVIFSPLCRLPVGQGLLERGVADFTE